MSLVPRLAQVGRPLKQILFQQGGTTTTTAAAAHPCPHPTLSTPPNNGGWLQWQRASGATNTSNKQQGQAQPEVEQAATGADWQRQEKREEFRCPWQDFSRSKYVHWTAVLALGYQLVKCQHYWWSHQPRDQSENKRGPLCGTINNRQRRILGTGDAVTSPYCCPITVAKRLAGFRSAESDSVLLRVLPSTTHQVVEAGDIFRDKVADLAVKEFREEDEETVVPFAWSRPHEQAIENGVKVKIVASEPEKQINVERKASNLDDNKSTLAKEVETENLDAQKAADDLVNVHEQILTEFEVQLAMKILESGHHRSSLTLLRRAALRGHPEALHNLGVMYLEGVGVRQSHVKAFRYAFTIIYW